MVAAVMASIGGAIFVPIAGIISPSNVDAAASIMMLAGVALGGRASLFGPVLGAIAVGYGRSTLSEKFPTQWTYFLGALFIVVILFLPGGVASLWPKIRALFSSGNRGGAVDKAPAVELDDDRLTDADGLEGVKPGALA
jgi:urea transport system permease protein